MAMAQRHPQPDSRCYHARTPARNRIGGHYLFRPTAIALNIANAPTSIRYERGRQNVLFRREIYCWGQAVRYWKYYGCRRCFLGCASKASRFCRAT